MNTQKLIHLLKTILILGFFIVSLFSCTKDKVFSASQYDCIASFSDTSANHPKAATYQNILDKNRKDGLVGAVLLVKDDEGLWIGASGKADLASNIDMQSCNVFMIASMSKMFTSSAVYKYIDRGVLAIDDPIKNWLSSEIINNITNADQVTIKNLLAHTSGIADIYTSQYELDRINKEHNEWTQEDVLTYVYGQPALSEIGSYYYCNTNFLLLGMILEKASGLTLEQVYQQEVFSPLGLTSAYYSTTQPIPDGAVKGYADIYGNGSYIESRMVYEDELGMGGDGGIAINAYDLSIFLEKLLEGELLSDNSLNEMTAWFETPDIFHGFFNQSENGVGIEKFNTEYGTAIGHTGNIDGFNSYGFYFPTEKATYVLLTNTVGDTDAEANIFEEVMAVIF